MSFQKEIGIETCCLKTRIFPTVAVFYRNLLLGRKTSHLSDLQGVSQKERKLQCCQVSGQASLNILQGSLSSSALCGVWGERKEHGRSVNFLPSIFESMIFRAFVRSEFYKASEFLLYSSVILVALLRYLSIPHSA